uniref:Putative secreted protein n=1 Tax=Anopheles triannulatus TaxID=58253 RepID=A0A2M4B2R7_9DIPT
MVRVAVVVAATLRLSSSAPVSEARRMMEDGRSPAATCSSSLMYRMTLARSGWGPGPGNASRTGESAVCAGGGETERHPDLDRDRERSRSRPADGGVRDLRELVALSSSRDSESVRDRSGR